ncbi:hypothetical protein Bca4012_003339 [Brassica carinata]
MALVPCNCLFNWFPLDEDLSWVCLYLEDESHPSTLSLSPWISLRSISSGSLLFRLMCLISRHRERSDECEPLEKSCLTKEHEKYLSDGSQSSKKRIRDASPSVESNIKEAEVVVPQVPQEDRVCSTSGTEISSSVSGHDENLLPASLDSDKTALLSESKKKKKHKTSKESRYSSLFDEPVLPCLSIEEDNSNSDDWLLGTRRQENVSTKFTMNEDMVMNLQKPGESCFPSSQFLSEVGIFSLPYTVLF